MRKYLSRSSILLRLRIDPRHAGLFCVYAVESLRHKGTKLNGRASPSGPHRMAEVGGSTPPDPTVCGRWFETSIRAADAVPVRAVTPDLCRFANTLERPGVRPKPFNPEPEIAS